MKRLWVLNLDADDELGAAGPYEPRAAVKKRIPELARRLGGLVPEGETWTFPGDPAPFQTGSFAEGVCWCPTPRALLWLAHRGVRARPHPPAEVLRRVAHRGFAVNLGGTPTEPRLLTDPEEAWKLLGEKSPSPTGEWLIKRVHGFSGRGHRRVAVPPSEADRAFVAASVRAGGAVVVVPWMERLVDLAQHGHLDARGALVLGEPTTQVVDAAGAWVESRRARPGELTLGVVEALRGEAETVAEALTRAGYFGPFGIDGFVFRGVDGGPVLEPRCDVNPRYTMGWAVGMAGRRVDLEP